MYGVDGILLLLANILFAVFRPSVAYKISVIILVLFLATTVLFDQDPSDRFFAIFGLLFVFSVVGTQILRAIRRQSVRDFQDIATHTLER